jgi:hypothetical protein
MTGRGHAWLPLTLFGLAVLGLLAVPAGAERAQRGNLIVTLNGGIKPLKLPRRERAPVAVDLAGGVQTTDGSPLPRVDRLKLELAWRGLLSTRGLPNCPRARLASTLSREALAACSGSLVGRGKLNAKIYLPNQRPFGVRANLLVFNGKSKAGRPAVLVHAYSTDPPVSFVIPFVVKRQPGAFRTVLVTTIRRAVGNWPHVSNFRIQIGRDFVHRGDRYSYLSASCPVPKNFTAGFLSFARATYTFAGGDQLQIESVRSCRAR